jgi:hypothetical protein
MMIKVGMQITEESERVECTICEKVGIPVGQGSPGESESGKVGRDCE